VFLADTATQRDRDSGGPLRCLATATTREQPPFEHCGLEHCGLEHCGRLARRQRAAGGAEVLTGFVQSERIADEQAALRRVATLVARAAQPTDVFAAVTAEVGRLLEADFTVLTRYDPEAKATIVGVWSSTGAAAPTPVGSRFELGGRNVHTQVFESRRPARTTRADASGAATDVFRVWGIRSCVGVPINVEDRLWGVMIVVSTREEPQPADTEARLACFTELVATAIANTQSRMELRGFAEEQAALRRVATLVARAAPPEEVFAAVTAEVGRVLSADATFMSRCEGDDAATIVGAWRSTGDAAPALVGSRVEPGGRSVHTRVFQTCRPTRIDDYAETTTADADFARAWGIRSLVGVPINVADRLWGVMIVAYAQEEPPPADTEARLACFTELVATAIANTQSRIEVRGFAEEQAALRRVATLVARAAPPEEVFAAVAAEVGQLLHVDLTVLSRYEPGGTASVVGCWARTDPGRPLVVGIRMGHGGRNTHTLVFRTRRPARVEDYRSASGPAADVGRDWGIRSAVGAPIDVEGRLWGVVSVGYTREEPLPADTEERLACFTELVGTALANAEAQAALTASRARIVAAADTTRRRIERDLHDGAQQRLVSLALRLHTTVRAAAPPEAHALKEQLNGVAAELGDVLGELREIARGIHPAALAEGGLRPALKSLARRSTVPVRLNVGVEGRLPEPIELAAYYVACEALTNTAKHAHASVIDVHLETSEDELHIHVRDDGCGGADLSRGSGLVGLQDRVEALGGRISLRSPPRAGTAMEIALPLTDPNRPGQPHGTG
jgi:signal transduction histidine kinase